LAAFLKGFPPRVLEFFSSARKASFFASSTSLGLNKDTAPLTGGGGGGGGGD